ncbi:MAG: hypothetical protein SNG38_01885 [Rikenellaceae bacterium]
MKPIFILQSVLCCFIALNAQAQQVDYSVVSVPEESGVDFKKITTDNDYVCMPIVNRTSKGVTWLTNRIIDISTNGLTIAYLSYRNNSSNIFIKDISKQGSSIQRTNRAGIIDFSYSPDGTSICFSESRNGNNQIYITDATNGYVCRQITSGAFDYSPVYTTDMKSIFFARQEQNGVSIWSYSVVDNFLSSFTSGMNPVLIPNKSEYICTRTNSKGHGEIWKINYETGVEECIISDVNRSFTSPVLSPNGQKILFVGASALYVNEKKTYFNTDIFVCNIDGSGFSQLTYHAADDLSPIWSKDGEHIYFISQRGSADAAANIWRMNFYH